MDIKHVLPPRWTRRTQLCEPPNKCSHVSGVSHLQLPQLHSMGFCTMLHYKGVPRLQECCRQFEADMVRNSRNKIHQTWERPYTEALYTARSICTALLLSALPHRKQGWHPIVSSNECILDHRIRTGIFSISVQFSLHSSHISSCLILSVHPSLPDNYHTVTLLNNAGRIH